MELAATQKLLARILTDSTLRNRFFADPVTIGASFGLSAEEARVLAELPKDDVHDFTKSIRRQRLETVTALLPDSVSILGRRFGELFREYVVKEQLPADAHPWTDAIRFCTACVKAKKLKVEVQRWELELMRYEGARLEFLHGEKLLQFHFSMSGVTRAAKALAAGKAVTSVLPIPGIAIFIRWSNAGAVSVLSI
ncbi:MAG: hypothetical protein ACPGVU_00665 [Limisphaerales bacterium]